MPLFDKQTRVAHKGMLSKVDRPFDTFLDRLREKQGTVASIDKAFGGRGRLLIHACVADNDSFARTPAERSDSMRRGSKAVSTDATFIQIIKGEMATMGDKRRLSLELRFKQKHPNLGTEVAHAIDSIDFNALDALASAGLLDPTSFIPTVTISTDESVNEKANQTIYDAFFFPEERDQLLEVEKAGDVQQLHSLEKRILPLVRIRAFTEKVKIFHVRMHHSAKEAEALQQLQFAARACHAITGSKHLLDLLGMTLQIVMYISKFGKIVVDEEGFSLLKLKEYENFKVGRRHSLLSVLCTFLGNLRPRGKDKARGGASLARGASFIEKLDAELKDVIEVKERGLETDDLQALLSEIAQMKAFLEQQRANERALFEPQDKAQTSDLLELDRFDEQRFDDLSSWASGKQTLRELVEHMSVSQMALDEAKSAFEQSERALKEFAAIPESDFERCSHIDVIAAVLQFVDHLKRASLEMKTNPSETLQLRQTLLGVTPVQIVFSADCLEAAFDLWLRKAAADNHRPKPWGREARRKAIHDLFRLFDTDADNSVDAEELRVTVQAFGVELPEPKDEKIQLELVRIFDTNYTGKLEFAEFHEFVEWRIQLVFDQFLQEKPKSRIAESKEESKVVKFEPGDDVGILADWGSGLITNVQPDSQADRLGVKSGWTFSKVEQVQFSEQRFHELLAGSQSFFVTFTGTQEPSGLKVSVREALSHAADSQEGNLDINFDNAGITEADLERVAFQLGRADANSDIRQKMIQLLDKDGLDCPRDGVILLAEFEQLLLAPPDHGAKGKEIDAFLDMPLFSRGPDGNPTPARSPRAWLLRGDPGDGGSSTDEQQTEEQQTEELN